MPSTVLSLETPARVWRNRGVCSLPRAKVWLDLFGPFTPPIDQLELSFYGRSVPDVRFLEDQDGTAAWQNLLNGISRGYMKDFGSGPGLSVAKVYDDFQAALKDNSKIFESLQDGYHFVDIPLPNEKIEVPDLRLAGILTDFDDSIRIVGLEDKESLMAEEAYGELEVEVKTVSAGRDSEYLPEVK